MKKLTSLFLILSQLASANISSFPGGSSGGGGGGGSGTVTSVNATVPSFLSVSGVPITSSGTIAISYSGTALPVANGGTGLTTLTANNVILGNGTSAPSFVAPGTSGNVLTSNGTTWTSAAPAASGVTTVGAFSGSAQTNGATISGSTITFGPADASTPGMVSTGTQTWAGAKTFSGLVTSSVSPAVSESSLLFSGAIQAGGSATTSLPMLLIQPAGASAASTWSASGNAIGVNAASGFAGRFIDFHVNGGASLFSVASTGALSTNSSASFAGNVTAPNVTLQAAGAFSWVGRGIITSSGAGNVQLGSVDAASPVAQTLSAQSVVAGTSNTAGQNFTIQASRGTGTGAGGSIIFNVAPADGSGTTQNTVTPALVIASDKSTTLYGSVATGDAGQFSINSTGNLTKVNNVTYSWPTTQGGSNTVLRNDGSGNLTWITASGTGDVVGPSSSVDGNIATFNGTTGKLIRSESKFSINATTGALTQTFAGGPSTLNSMDLSTATTWSIGRLVTGTSNTTASTAYLDRYNFTFDIGSTTRNFYMSSLAQTISGSTSGIIAREFGDFIGSSSGNAFGGGFESSTGVFGNFMKAYNTNASTGGVLAMYGWANANRAIGVRGFAYSGFGSSGRTVGVNGVGIATNTTVNAGGYFVLYPDASGTPETSTAFPSSNGALVANNGTVSANIFVAQDNGTNTFLVLDGGATQIGATSATPTHILNTATQAIGGQTLDLSNGPAAVTTSAPSVYVKIQINGSNYVIPAWPIP